MLASSLPDRRRQRHAALLVAVLCTLFATLRAAESLAHLTRFDWPAVFSALRWRIWDWWFWIPVVNVMWNRASPHVHLRITSWRALPFHVAAAIGVLFIHRGWSLLGMLLFHPDATWSLHSVSQLFAIAPSLAITDLLTWSALVASCAAGRHAVERRERLARRRLHRAAVARHTAGRTGNASNAGNAGNAANAANAANAELNASVSAVLAAPAPVSLPLERLLVRIGRRQQVINLADVTWFEADGYCTRLHTEQGTTHLVRLSMARLEQCIDPAAFVRVHRSALVSTSRIRELKHAPDGSHRLRLSNDQWVPVSRARYGALRRRLAEGPKSP